MLSEPALTKIPWKKERKKNSMPVQFDAHVSPVKVESIQESWRTRRATLYANKRT
uniref:Uncharacterized protein n=1 Tax=Arundo donax TaxID=35708 RepID=A0A0A8ZRU3_ARUDO